jgi:hypothetical protein
MLAISQFETGTEGLRAHQQQFAAAMVLLGSAAVYRCDLSAHEIERL